MAGTPSILRVGLTGGAASGKSTVAEMLGHLGALVVDADRLVHEMTSPGGTAFDLVLGHFGADILDDSGAIDRERLGQIVFADADARRALEKMLHPAVRNEAAQRFDRAARDRSHRIGIFDAALLVETGAYRDFHRVVVVRCSRETQILRMGRRDGLSRAQAEARLSAQAPLESKLAVADYVIDTETSLDDTRKRAERVFEQLLSDFDRVFPDRDR